MTQEVWLWVVSGILTGTSVTALFRYLTTRRFQSISLEQKLRAEMFEQIDNLKQELATLKQELDHWRDKYLTLSKEYNKLKNEFDKLKKDK